MKTYESECQELVEEVMRRREPILEKVKQEYESRSWIGLDGEPYKEELKAVTDWFNEEWQKIAKKYGRVVKKASGE